MSKQPQPTKPPPEEPDKPYPVENPPQPQPNEDFPLTDPVPPDIDLPRMTSGVGRSSNMWIIRVQWVDQKGQLSKLYPLLSILMALALALFEFFFFFQISGVEETAGPFGPDRLGFTLAWIALVYPSSFSPFPLLSERDRFIGVVDGMASVVPFGVSLVVIFGKPELLGTSTRWEAALLLSAIAAVDLFGGYIFNIALSRRTMEVAGPAVWPSQTGIPLDLLIVTDPSTLPAPGGRHPTQTRAAVQPNADPERNGGEDEAIPEKETITEAEPRSKAGTPDEAWAKAGTTETTADKSPTMCSVGLLTPTQRWARARSDSSTGMWPPARSDPRRRR